MAVGPWMVLIKATLKVHSSPKSSNFICSGPERLLMQEWSQGHGPWMGISTPLMHHFLSSSLIILIGFGVDKVILPCLGKMWQCPRYISDNILSMWLCKECSKNSAQILPFLWMVLVLQVMLAWAKQVCKSKEKIRLHESCGTFCQILKWKEFKIGS